MDSFITALIVVLFFISMIAFSLGYYLRDKDKEENKENRDQSEKNFKN